MAVAVVPLVVLHEELDRNRFLNLVVVVVVGVVVVPPDVVRSSVSSSLQLLSMVSFVV